jgi:uncharacterized protein YfaP (DUF2135 family)
MSQDTKELRVGANENAKRIMYLAKEFLLNNETIDVVSGTAGAIYATRAAEGLVRLQYVTYANIRTETNIVNERRRTRLVITLKKTSQFAKLYEENEANKKKYQDEKNNQEKTPQTKQ